MSLRILSGYVPRFSFRRFYATSLKDYESLYEIMEVEPTATKTEIRESWLRLSMMYHPDLNKDSEDAKEKFMKIKEAYKVLNNEEERMRYNEKIGFHHHDPPPDYHHDWTYDGEMDKIKARIYRTRWDEKKIRDLMSSEKLREVDWNTKTPAERYKILMAEEERRLEALENQGDSHTPAAPILLSRFMVLWIFIAGLCVYAYRVSIVEESEIVKEIRRKQEIKMQPVTFSNGVVADGSTRNNQSTYSLFMGLKELKEERSARFAAEREAALDTQQSASQTAAVAS
eukprot:TRINITY_DN2221_c0_g1_i1.p1 TRINITY_DN2221_c0_g1~~TRINITY_DN2221_c0_g1_i1.p1  ORF type:complete len:285 (-),score=41.18 TRINITY_DN2221_c0_g1_i1:94-948(-)